MTLDKTPKAQQKQTDKLDIKTYNFCVPKDTSKTSRT